LIKI